MENKRPRAEVTVNAVGQPTSMTSLSISALSDQSNETDSDCLSTQSNNMVLTICNEIESDDSQDLLCFNDPLMHIKKEEDDVSQLQYHIMNPLLGAGMEDGASTNNSISDLRNTPSTVSPTTVQLPSGCDIYLVKEFVGKQESGFDSAENSVVMKPNTSTKIMNERKDKQHVLCNPFMVQPPAHMAMTEAKDTAYGSELNDSKRSYILETYKKRDEKRRATHNEVERRRRDKINNWIFKLKEMLPEVTTSNYLNASNSSGCNLSSSTTTFGKSTASAPFSQQERGSVPNRSPPNESKSQILIKACEYIRSMQEELKSLRECLSENEKLRLNNQRLQNELDKLKQDEGRNQNYILSNNNNDSSSMGTNLSLDDNNTCNSDSFNLALNGFNSNSCMFLTNDPTTMSYTKRELIIRDYVD